jgi:replicative DNA helicase
MKLNGKQSGDNLVDVESESTVIGQLINQKMCQIEGIPLLDETTFTDTDFAKVFRIMKQLFDKNQSIDLSSIEAEKKKMGINYDLMKIIKATDIATGATNAQLIMHLNELRIRRNAVPIVAVAKNNFADLTLDIIETINSTSKELFLLTSQISKSRIKSLSEVYMESSKNIQDKDEEILLAEYSIQDLNESTIGFTGGDITIIAGRPGMGKTSFAMQELRYASKTVNTGLVSIEMTAKQIMYREISSLLAIPMNKLISKKGLTSTEIAQVKELERYFQDKMYIVDDARTLTDIKVSLYKLIELFNVKVWAIDYIQLVSHSSKRNSKNADVEEVSGELKAIAKSTNTHGLILSQMSRDQEKGTTNLRKPRLSDLRDSGALEQDASNVIFVHRPEAQGVDEDKYGNSLIGKAQLVVAKARNGKIRDVEVDFIADKYQFKQINPLEPESPAF